MDTRMAGGTLSTAQSASAPAPGLSEVTSAATVKALCAHTKGGVSSLVAHAHAPLLATGTAHQVVKVWTDGCEVVGAIRAQSSHLASKMGPVTCMAWHPCQPLLGAGGGDGVVAVYTVDQGRPGAVGQAGGAGNLG